MNDFAKQVVNKAKEEAIKAARQMRQEPVEVLKAGKAQVTGQTESQKPGMSMMQEVMTQSGKYIEPSYREEQSINIQAKRRLAEIEAELRQLRMQREQQSVNWARQQQQLMGAGQEQKPKAVEEPTTRPKRGMMGGAGKKKGGTKEMGKQTSG